MYVSEREVRKLQGGGGGVVVPDAWCHIDPTVLAAPCYPKGKPMHMQVSHWEGGHTGSCSRN